jgi:DNA modification methylase
MPMDVSRYPENWNEISIAIRHRDGWRCKFCGVPNGAIGYRVDGNFVMIAESREEVETAQSVGLAWGGSTEPLGDDEGEIESNRHAELIEKWGTKTGQLWLIPSITNRFVTHRLLCGDCTVPDDVKRVMDGQRAVLFATDPPYLVEYDGTNHPHKWGSPDENKDWSELYIDPTWDKADGNENLYDDFIRLAVGIAITPNAAWYCWHASRRQAMLEAVWERHGAFVHQQIIWAKDRPVLTRSWYMWQHEPCFMGWVKGKKPPRYGDDHPRSVWEFPTILPGVKTDHPTSKPIELFEIPMKQHTQVGEICYDPFMGSGSQLVAGEKLGRAVYGIEQEPAFIAVILERIAAMGLTPKLS